MFHFCEHYIDTLISYLGNAESDKIINNIGDKVMDNAEEEWVIKSFAELC